VKPALKLLAATAFSGPNKEFMAAHEHFRHARVEEACTEACKTFESTMKVICDLRRWTYDKNATASALIKALVENGLVRGYAEEHLHSLQKCLIGVATLRNKNSGHGAGSVPRDLPDHFAAYALHLAASNIVFLIKCHEAAK
jgi:hypothetical protein